MAGALRTLVQLHSVPKSNPFGPLRTMTFSTHPALWIEPSIAWFYLATNALRVVTYLPQIVAVKRSEDGARAVSLLTWGSWVVANATAILYGLMLQDPFFTAISAINFGGCSAVTWIAAQRRIRFAQKLRTVTAATMVAGGRDGSPTAGVEVAHPLRLDPANAPIYSSPGSIATVTSLAGGGHVPSFRLASHGITSSLHHTNAHSAPQDRRT